MDEYNNENTLMQYSNKIWITKNSSFGKNVCIRSDNGNFRVIGYLDKKDEQNLHESIVNCIIAEGYKPEDYL